MWCICKTDCLLKKNNLKKRRGWRRAWEQGRVLEHCQVVPPREQCWGSPVPSATCFPRPPWSRLGFICGCLPQERVVAQPLLLPVAHVGVQRGAGGLCALAACVVPNKPSLSQPWLPCWPSWKLRWRDCVVYTEVMQALPCGSLPKEVSMSTHLTVFFV